jgi:hypothetical protein
MITDNLSSHNSHETTTWLSAHPRLHHVFIPTGAGSVQFPGGLVGVWGASSAVMPLPDRVRPPPRRLNNPPASQLLNSICEPSPGSGGALLKAPRCHRRLFCYRM